MNSASLPQPPTPKAGEVRLWYTEARILNDLAAQETFLSLLSPFELQRYGRYRCRENRQEYLLGRAMVRLIAGSAASVPPCELQLAAGNDGKPEIVGPPSARKLKFNISHSCGMVVAAFALEREVGVDVEDCRRSVADGVINHSMTRSEIARLAELRSEHRQSAFITRWSMKEAYAKARGLGLLIPFSGLSIDYVDGVTPPIQFDQAVADDVGVWRFFLLRLWGRYSCAVVVQLKDRDAPPLLARDFGPDWRGFSDCASRRIAAEPAGDGASR